MMDQLFVPEGPEAVLNCGMAYEIRHDLSEGYLITSRGWFKKIETVVIPASRSTEARCFDRIDWFTPLGGVQSYPRVDRIKSIRLLEAFELQHILEAERTWMRSNITREQWQGKHRSASLERWRERQAANMPVLPLDDIDFDACRHRHVIGSGTPNPWCSGCGSQLGLEYAHQLKSWTVRTYYPELIDETFRVGP